MGKKQRKRTARCMKQMTKNKNGGNKKETEIERGRKIRKGAHPTAVKHQLIIKAEIGNIQSYYCHILPMTSLLVQMSKSRKYLHGNKF
jgi:hypothetical protein